MRHTTFLMTMRTSGPNVMLISTRRSQSQDDGDDEMLGVAKSSFILEGKMKNWTEE